MYETNTTEIAVSARINQMEGQPFIAEAFGLFDDCCTQDLLRAHALCSRITILYAVGKVLQNHFSNGRNGVESLTNPVQLFGPGVLNIARHQWHLFLILFAHFLVAPFFAFVVILIGCTFFITTWRRICPS